MASTAFHFGKWLKDRIEQKGVPLKTFAERVGCSEATLHSWLGSPAPAIRGFNRGRLAHALGMEKTAVENYLEAGARGDSIETMQSMFDQGMHAGGVIAKMATARAKSRGFDANVEPYGAEVLPEVPTFDLSVAAGSWVEVVEHGEVFDPCAIGHGRFRVRVRGDSMSPKYRDGSIVEFKCLRPDQDGLEVGKNYYVQRNDGMATFKQLAAVDEDALTLRALNGKKYKEPMIVARQEVVRMARAIGQFTPD